MAESTSEQGATPSTSTQATPPTSTQATPQSPDVLDKPLIPLVSLPKVVLTRLDINNLPVPVSPMKKSVKRLDNKKKPITPKAIQKKPAPDNKHDPRTRGRPKQNYKALAEFGTSDSDGIMKKESKLSPKSESRSVKSMLNKTMLQKRSKIAIPPAKKQKLTPTKTPLNKTKGKPPQVPSRTQSSSFGIGDDDSDDDSLFNELIDEMVKKPKTKIVTERTTNITLKPNVGNKPPTIVKGGIVKRSSLPPDLKSVASPTTLNSSKHTVISLNVQNKSPIIENTIKTPATAESPKASLPVKASPFPISLNSPSKAGSRDGKKGRTFSEKTVPAVVDDSPVDFYEPINSNHPVESAPKQNSSATTPRPRGRPRIGPKQAVKPVPSFSSTADAESDEYTEIETLENMDSEIELDYAKKSDSTRNGNVLEVKHIEKTPNKSLAGSLSNDNVNKDEDPNIDLIRILTDDTESAASSESKKSKSGASHVVQGNSNKSTSDDLAKSNSTISNDAEIQKSPVPQSVEPLPEQNEASEVSKEPVTEEPPVRTVYDLMNEVSLQYPSWNLHIIPETNAFCIAQVTKGRLGLPTLKKCIELDPESYCAKVYIHQYHIKRFDGVYDSEEAILALIEEIHSIKA